MPASSEPSRSSDAVAAALDAAARRVAAAVAALETPAPVVLIDGRSGAGKTTLVERVVASWPLDNTPHVVALDSLYPGWDGLADGVATALDRILIPHACGMVGEWQRWDWGAGDYAERHVVDPALPLIVEGSGILTPATARLADVRVWLESPATSRRRRALDRDGDTYRPHWERWARQEDRHVSRDDPTGCATLVLRIP